MCYTNCNSLFYTVRWKLFFVSVSWDSMFYPLNIPLTTLLYLSVRMIKRSMKWKGFYPTEDQNLGASIWWNRKEMTSVMQPGSPARIWVTIRRLSKPIWPECEHVVSPHTNSVFCAEGWLLVMTEGFFLVVDLELNNGKFHWYMRVDFDFLSWLFVEHNEKPIPLCNFWSSSCALRLVGRSCKGLSLQYILPLRIWVVCEMIGG